MQLRHSPFLCAALASLLIVSALFVLSSRVHADISWPVRIKLLFEQGGKPYNGPVRFVITCYGYSYPLGPDPQLAPGSYTPEAVYSLAGFCEGYGCTATGRAGLTRPEDSWKYAGLVTI